MDKSDSDYNFAGAKTYHPDKWPCCSGTLPQTAADYRISTYFRDRRGIYVNLYIPSTLTWMQDGTRLSITQAGKYPLEGAASFVVKAPRPVEFAMRLRIPAWAGDRNVLLLNGKRLNQPLQPGTFATVQRAWKNGDRLELELPLPMRVVPVDAQHTKVAALMRGPLVLFPAGETLIGITARQLLDATRNGDAWEAQTEKGKQRFLPFAAIGDEMYSTYLQLT